MWFSPGLNSDFCVAYVARTRPLRLIRGSLCYKLYKLLVFNNTFVLLIHNHIIANEFFGSIHIGILSLSNLQAIQLQTAIKSCCLKNFGHNFMPFPFHSILL